MININLNEYSPLAFSYLGDSVIELMVRAFLVKKGNYPTGELNVKAKLFIKAVSQSKAVDKMLEHLTEEETDIYKRGRNAKNKTPKSASVAEYKRSTGMECLFGYLYLQNNTERLEELFNIAYADVIKQLNEQ